MDMKYFSGSNRAVGAVLVACVKDVYGHLHHREGAIRGHLESGVGAVLDSVG